MNFILSSSSVYIEEELDLVTRNITPYSLLTFLT